MIAESIYQSRGILPEEQRLYDHLLYLVQNESPQALTERFRLLFIEATGHPNATLQQDLDRLVQSKNSSEDFRFILNRCCHILINRWQSRPQCYSAIAELIALFELAPTRPVTSDLYRSRIIKQQRHLIQAFRSTEQYLTLKRLATVLQPAEFSIETERFGTLIRRYPYLYEHCLVTEGTPASQQASIRQLQVERQKQFEIDLSKYVTYQVRCAVSDTATPGRDRVIYPVQNPTLLDERSLSAALHEFTGKVNGNDTCREVAQRFSAHCQEVRSYREFKRDLYGYLTDVVNPAYGKRHFNRQFANLLNDIHSESESQPLTDFLMLRTCSQLLNFLVVESAQNPQHFVLVDLLSNLGATSTTRLLLQIVLLCQRIKPYLEKRFSILFHHYESYSRDGVQWLIAAMENLQLALTTNFSTLNLCFVHQLVR
ncbi:hypothetical protein NC981_16400 [Leptolyngbya sp. DQ-M1]|uniref:hypothetical protein n=1 Tax=Leptolyngbya sp. DQ-M1 TaxID=2933920 RepID=UPI003297BA0B